MQAGAGIANKRSFAELNTPALNEVMFQSRSQILIIQANPVLPLIPCRPACLWQASWIAAGCMLQVPSYHVQQVHLLVAESGGQHRPSSEGQHLHLLLVCTALYQT